MTLVVVTVVGSETKTPQFLEFFRQIALKKALIPSNFCRKLTLA